MTTIEDRVRVDSATLNDTATRILERVGVPSEGAADTAHNLVTADERGVETHGLMRLRSYVDRIEAGGIAANPRTSVVRDGPTTALLDGDNGLGAVVGARAMNLAVDKAAVSGIGLVVVRNLNHYGAAAHYSLMAVRRNMIGLSATNVLALIAPTGGSVPMIGNNPLSLAFPTSGSDPVVWDSAMSASTWGRALLAFRDGEQLPPDSFLDSAGRPTTDPTAVFAGGSLLPIAGYKGYGLALCISLLTGVLGDWRFDAEISMPTAAAPGDNTALMGAIDVGRFVDVREYTDRVGRITDSIRAASPSSTERIWLPGEKEAERARDRRTRGVPLSEAVRADIAALADRFGVEIDERLRVAGQDERG